MSGRYGHHKAVVLLLSTWGVLFVIAFIPILQFKPDGLYASHPYVWADWSLHIAIAMLFAYQDPRYWFTYHPMYATGGLNYTFLTNLISGLLIKAGLSIYAAFVIPSILYAILLLIGMYGLFYLVLRSKTQSLVAISIFFLSSGLGFVRFLRDLWHHSPLLTPDPGADYSRFIQYQWYTGNFFGFFLPQRSFLLGMMLGIWALVGLLYAVRYHHPNVNHRSSPVLRPSPSLLKPSAMTRTNIILLASACLVGLLPIAHLHSFIVVMLVSSLVCLASYRRWMTLVVYYLIPASALSTTTYLLFIARGIETTASIRWSPGFTSPHGWLFWIEMWLKLWGAMLPVAIAGFCLLRQRSLVVKLFFFSFFLVFAIANLIIFQYFAWDNSKLFLWVYFGFSGLAAVVLSWLWHHRNRFVSRSGAIVLVVLLTLTGFLELLRLQHIALHPKLISSREDMQLGLQIRKTTTPLSRFLTAPIHNHPVMMWGVRPILLGEIGWVRSYGFASASVERDVAIMYAGGSNAELLLKQYNIHYVVIDSSEETVFWMNESFYAKRYPLAFYNQRYRIYDVH